MGRFESFIGVDFWTALFVLLNTIAIFLVARKFLFQPVHKLISDRQSEIDRMYADAQKLRLDAERADNELKQKLASAQSESDRIVKEALNRAETKEREIISAARKEAAEVLDKAALDAQREKKQVLSDAKDEIASIAVAIAEKVVQKQLDESDQAKLANEFIARLGDDQ